MTTNGPKSRRDDEADEAVKLFAGDGPIEDPGAVDEHDEPEESPVSDTDVQPPG
jgi:hypothetical protein